MFFWEYKKIVDNQSSEFVIFAAELLEEYFKRQYYKLYQL